jgi:hypothetical protein
LYVACEVVPDFRAVRRRGADQAHNSVRTRFVRQNSEVGRVVNIVDFSRAPLLLGASLRRPELGGLS